MRSFRYRERIVARPRKVDAGELLFVMPNSYIQRGAEEALIARFMCDRKLFGLAYCKIQPDYFDSMSRESRVFIAPLVQTSRVLRCAERPGDIDLLVIPYDADQLILERVVAIEVKAVRASFEKQGKSPNEFGFSQARSLLNLGFPYVAVAHLIISDVSPQEHWREMMMAEILDHTGRARNIGTEKVDMLPDILTERSFGRMKKHCPVADVGLISAYLFSSIFGNCSPNYQMLHFPSGRPAALNPQMRIQTLEAVAAYFHKNHALFLDTPRYDPK